MKREPKKIVVTLVIIALITSLAGCQPSEETGEELPKAEMTARSEFANYQELAVEVVPSIKPYSVGENLSNVINKDKFPFTDEAIKKLAENHFIVAPAYGSEFFTTYELNRYDFIPNFITTDAMLHNYHLYFSHLLRSTEKDYLYGQLKELTDILLDESLEIYDELKGSAWENAAKRNVGFFSVACELLNMGHKIPAYVSDEVKQELALIDAHKETMAISPVMNIGADKSNLIEALKEDYTQYIPRSHYAGSEELKSYFKAMMWYGRMTFRASRDDETKSAALICLQLNDETAYEHWYNIYEPTNFFVGKSDDLDFYEYFNLIKKVYGKVPNVAELRDLDESWSYFLEEAAKLEPPAINSMPIFDADIQPDRDEAIKGFRLMGQRFTLDASIFQRLIYREVEENDRGRRRMLPRGLDIPAAMGSDEAYEILKEMGETSYKNYDENMKMMKDGIKKLDLKTRTQNLYWSWLHMLSPLTEAKGEGYPMFMQSKAWTKKQLETYLGSWTELKHDTVLYAKQSYAEMGGGSEEILDDRGYVEPNPHVFGRLASITRMTIEGLKSRNLLKTETEGTLEILETLALSLKTIAEKELIEQPLSDEEYDLIRSFGGQLEHLWLEALKDKGVDSASAAYVNPAALVTDVATNPGGEVLQEATGHVNDIYVIVSVEGILRIAKGTVYSYYEFPWDAGDRLTDEKWQEMLINNDVPDPPFWTRSYTVLDGLGWW